MSSEEAKKKKPAAEETAKKPTLAEGKKPAPAEAKKPAPAEAKKPAPAEAKKPAAEEAAKKKKKKAVRVSSYYKITDGGLQRKLKTCPRCGLGVFLSEHYDRISCGRCGYSEYKRKGESPG
jgi:small subunit ribosomal protein S27Ae